MSLLLNRTTFGDPKNAGNVMSREDAYDLLADWVKNERLQLHMKQVAHLMKCWAAEKEQLPEADQWRWEMAGDPELGAWLKKVRESLEQGRKIDLSKKGGRTGGSCGRQYLEKNGGGMNCQTAGIVDQGPRD